MKLTSLTLLCFRQYESPRPNILSAVPNVSKWQYNEGNLTDVWYNDTEICVSVVHCPADGYKNLQKKNSTFSPLAA
jgi:hypothetical protein